jgi:2-methylisocitrate lyase-like PEP mutase family enzyme
MQPSKARQYRDMIASPDLIVSAGAYDGYSARLIEKAGFKSVATSGAAISNSRMGIADMGIMGLAENLDQCRAIVRAVNIPVTCDADTGYGNPVNVYHTVREFEAIGAVGVNIEDQVSPKRCGHMTGKEVIESVEMQKKIDAACRARRDDDFVIAARTDALAVEGLDKTLQRIQDYVRAGADMIFVDAIDSEQTLARVIDVSDAPVTVNMGFGIRERPTTPLIPLPRLKQMGVKRISLPRMLPAAAIMGMRTALEVMRVVIETGEPQHRPDILVGIEDIMDLMDYKSARALEAELLTVDSMDAKYDS